MTDIQPLKVLHHIDNAYPSGPWVTKGGFKRSGDSAVEINN